jgi:hypothetical protein
MRTRVGHQEASPSPVYGAALLMRLGFTPLRGSNPRASAPGQPLRPPDVTAGSILVIIFSPGWANDGPSGRGPGR